MRAVDTNVLVRLLTRDDPEQTSAAEEFVSKGACWVSHVVLVETIWVLDSVFDIKRPELAIALEMLLSHENLVIQEPEVVASALVSYRKRSKVGFSDCMVLEIAKKAGHTPVATFDRAFGKLAGAQLI